MPYYHNQRSYAGRNTGCQTPCPEDRPTPIQPRPACQVGGSSCGDDTNPCCSLAVANVVNQKPDSPTYDVCDAFVIGTIFKELDKPFTGRGGCR